MLIAYTKIPLPAQHTTAMIAARMKSLLLLLSLTLCCHAADKPNIVLFVTDDQSPIAGCYGSKIIQTPHLDQLASEGTRFNFAFATTASCSASRSVILTGLHKHSIAVEGVFGLRRVSEETTLQR